MAGTRDTKSTLSTIVDTTTSATFIYIGKTEIGNITSAAVWKVQRINKTNGALIEQANGGTADQIWDNRVGLTYAL